METIQVSSYELFKSAVMDMVTMNIGLMIIIMNRQWHHTRPLRLCNNESEWHCTAIDDG